MLISAPAFLAASRKKYIPGCGVIFLPEISKRILSLQALAVVSGLMKPGGKKTRL